MQRQFSSIGVTNGRILAGRHPIEKLSFDIHLAAQVTMRASLPISLLLVALLSACASQKDIPPSKHISQTGALRVHPGLLNQPVPPELRGPQPAAAGASEPAENRIQMDETGLRIQRSVYFDFNSTDIKTDYEPGLRAHARYLASHPKARVRIEGNADERGSVEYNRRLGLKRAESVRAALVGAGAKEKQVLVRSLGETHPRLTGRDEESWAENRRADVIYEKED